MGRTSVEEFDGQAINELSDRWNVKVAWRNGMGVRLG